VSQNPLPVVHLVVITPRRLLCEADAEEVSIPGLDGLIGILPGHRPMMISLGRGILSYRQGTETEGYGILGGYAEILPDKVLVFTDVDDEGQEK
jgi:F-type H+-transporting ATPase subunit epsilon